MLHKQKLLERCRILSQPTFFGQTFDFLNRFPPTIYCHIYLCFQLIFKMESNILANFQLFQQVPTPYQWYTVKYRYITANTLLAWISILSIGIFETIFDAIKEVTCYMYFSRTNKYFGKLLTFSTCSHPLPMIHCRRNLIFYCKSTFCLNFITFNWHLWDHFWRNKKVPCYLYSTRTNKYFGSTFNFRNRFNWYLNI